MSQGGFLIIFDGLNEITEAEAKKIIQFADMQSKYNHVCISSQIASNELTRIASLITCGPLSKAKVNELIQKQVQDHEAMIGKLTDGSYELCANPFQLELVITIWNSSHELPSTLDELYSRVLGPLVDREFRRKEGHGDYPDIISGLAFELLSKKQSYDASSVSLPIELRETLLKSKILVERQGLLEFRHDRIRAYLAAAHFGRHWRTIFEASELTIDENWVPMAVFFVAGEKNQVRLKDFLFAYLDKDAAGAREAFNFLRRYRPENVAPFAKDFLENVGKQVLEAEGSQPY